MSVIYVLIPLAVIIVALAIGVFFWAVKSNQFDDLERQGYSILFDDDIKKKPDARDNEGDSSAVQSENNSSETPTNKNVNDSLSEEKGFDEKQ
uniref:cbb3-type cytochrome oxidase assembly protein CcoS n=1 Tax=Ningiella ruwaisensis TaxID=2364274 RepID=UPI00109F5BC9|nr:cbb3-type cytochrome oxidase assembly protein CcoS [Ningiella ruwaisensis]